MCFHIFELGSIAMLKKKKSVFCPYSKEMQSNFVDIIFILLN